MNGTQNMEDIITLTSLMASPIEHWRDQWMRNGQLRMLSHPSTSYSHLASKTVREMRDIERTLRMDLWAKVQRYYPRISLESFREVFNGLMAQAYFGVKEDLMYYGKEREAIMHK